MVGKKQASEPGNKQVKSGKLIRQQINAQGEKNHFVTFKKLTAISRYNQDVSPVIPSLFDDNKNSTYRFVITTQILKFRAPFCIVTKVFVSCQKFLFRLFFIC